MTIIKVRFKKLGGHVHCRVFTNSAGLDGTFAKNGDLVFSEAEWPSVFDQLNRVAQVVPEETCFESTDRAELRNAEKSRAGI